MTVIKKAIDSDVINYKNLLYRTIIGTVIIVLLFVVIGTLFKNQLFTISKAFVDSYGIFAVFFGFLLTAISPIPLPDHALSAFAWIGGINFWINVSVSTFGSLIGGIIAYNLGKLLKHTRLYKNLMKKYQSESKHLINNHGIKGLAIACLTPIPDSPVMWICGAFNLSFKKFFWTLLICRFIKITYILWFIKLGLMAV